MKLKLLDMNKFTRGLKPVTTTELKTRSGENHPDGLLSEKIFGIEGSLDRSKRFSFIQLNAEVVHPAAYKLLIRIDRRIEKFLNTEETFSLNSEGEMILDEKGVSGMREFIKLFPQIKFKAGTPAREKIIKVIQDAYKQGALFISSTPVIPPDLRPIYEDESKNLVIDEINNIYINILRKASQVKSVGKGSALYNLLNFYLQNVVNDHDAYVRTKISKKSGLIRANMLGKRVDFSARAVITPGPDLKVNQIGVPLRIAVSLFQPFLIHYLLFSKKYPNKIELEREVKSFTESELSVDTVNRVIKSIKLGDKTPKKLYDLFFEATEIVMQDRVVLSKRDPALHDGSYRAFYPVLIHGSTIRICTLVVSGFNADFDGDQMALFHPLTREAQQEAKDRMMNGRGSKHSEHVTFEISKEMVVGLYTMTKNKPRANSPLAITNKDMEKATDPYIRVKYKGKITTMGRAIFNSAFPSDYPFINELITKKFVNSLIPKIITKYGDEVAIEVFSKVEKMGFKFATIMAPSFSIDDLEMPDSILRIKDKLPGSSPEEADKLLKDAEKIMINHLKNTGLYDLVESGAGKGWGQPRQILVAKGVIADPKGNILPTIKGSFADGLETTEYFSAASGARKGMADRALNTAETGYFTRQLVYVLGPVEASPTNKDCKTKRVVTLRLTNDLIKRLVGRNIIYGGKVYEFIPSKFKPGDIINLRTPIFCESHKICHTCYGRLLNQHKTPYVGILAGASIGERGTQLIMRCSDGLVHYNGNLIPFIDLFRMGTNYRKNKSLEIVDFDKPIKGKDGFVNTTTIQKHPPEDKMLFIKTQSGHSIICQANHPLWIKKHSLDKKLYKTDHTLKEILASDIKKHDCIWIDNSDAVLNMEQLSPNFSGYEAGIYFAKGCEDGSQRINNIILREQSSLKRLKYDFINYSKQWLKEFFSGLIDGNGIVFTNNSTCCRIYTDSYYFTQQLNAICLKLGYKFNINLVSSDLGKKKRTQISFRCDIRFYKAPKLNSIKIKEHKKIIILKNKPQTPLQGFDKITLIKENLWQYPVYDIKTNTNEYLLNFIQNHNTFHTGGAAIITIHKILKDILDNDPMININLKKYLSQNEDKLITLKPCKLTINMTNYNMNDNLQINKDHVWVNHLLSGIEYKDTMFNLILDYPIHINKVNMKMIGKERLEFNFTGKDVIIEVPMSTTEIKEQVNYVSRLLGGKVVYKDPAHLITKIMKVYGGSVSDLDLVHFEVLISQTLRDKIKPMLPARMGKKWDPIMMNIKNAVFSSGFIEGLNFENVNKAIEMGLISEGDLEPSLLGRIVTGGIVKK